MFCRINLYGDSGPETVPQWRPAPLQRCFPGHLLVDAESNSYSAHSHGIPGKKLDDDNLAFAWTDLQAWRRIACSNSRMSKPQCWPNRRFGLTLMFHGRLNQHIRCKKYDRVKPASAQ